MSRAGPSGGPALGAPKLGQTIAGKYELSRLLGEGGMASVFEAKHLRLKQRVAIKLLAPELVRDPELVTRFEHEARAVANLRTPHVPRVMDVDTTPEGIPFIVMEFLEGRDLDAELAARGRIPLDEACDWLLQACAAMIEAHDLGIIHRDLKPANLYLANEGTEKIVKVLDFGISKVLGEATKLTGAGAVMGTVLYMSPEQVRAARDVDVRADLWSLGVILYELVAGRPPWTGSSYQIAAAIVRDSPTDLRSLVHVPDPFANVVHRLLERDREKRFPNVRELVAALSPYARPGSVGGLVAEQVSSGTGARHRAVGAGHAVKSKTVPLMPSQSWTPPPPRPSSPQTTAPTPPPGGVATGRHSLAMPSAPSSRAPASVPSPPPRTSKTFVALAILVGLAGAIGTVLFFAWWMKKQQAPIGAPASSSSSITAVSNTPPSASAPTPEIRSSTVTPAPPPTGTATVEPKSSSTPGPRKPGGRAFTTGPTTTVTPAAPPAPSVNPRSL